MNFILEKLSKEVAADFIKLVNGAKSFEKNGEAKTGKFNYKWVLLDDILDHVKSDANFSLIQPLGIDPLNENKESVRNIFIHKTGEVLDFGWFPLGFKESDTSQEKGIKTTYMRRYSVGSILGVAVETDNDGKEPNEVEDKKDNPELKKAAAEITRHFNWLLEMFGTKDAVYQVLGTNRKQFMVDFESRTIELLEQVKKIVAGLQELKADELDKYISNIKLSVEGQQNVKQ